MSVDSQLTITTCEMHSAGEPVRIIETGYPSLLGRTLLDKRRYAREHLDALRRCVMWEPRGHHDMYGALLVQPDLPEADLAVLFMHNEGYSTMCGHAVIALARYAVDRRLVRSVTEPETPVNIQCPCGLVRAFVNVKEGRTGATRFHSVPAFTFAIDYEVDVPGFGRVHVDIAYGGAFYAVIPDTSLRLDVRRDTTADIVKAATAVSDAVKASVQLHHPDSPDLAFLYGTIVTDGQDEFSDKPTANLTVFADREVDRAPTGSGVTARIAAQYKRSLIQRGQRREFESAATGACYSGMVVEETKCGEFDAVCVEVQGAAYYTGSAVFRAEDADALKGGFLLR